MGGRRQRGWGRCDSKRRGRGRGGRRGGVESGTRPPPACIFEWGQKKQNEKGQSALGDLGEPAVWHKLTHLDACDAARTAPGGTTAVRRMKVPRLKATGPGAPRRPSHATGKGWAKTHNEESIDGIHARLWAAGRQRRPSHLLPPPTILPDVSTTTGYRSWSRDRPRAAGRAGAPCGAWGGGGKPAPRSTTRCGSETTPISSQLQQRASERGDGVLMHTRQRFGGRRRRLVRTDLICGGCRVVRLASVTSLARGRREWRLGALCDTPRSAAGSAASCCRTGVQTNGLSLQSVGCRPPLYPG